MDDESDDTRSRAETVERWRCPTCGEWLPIEMEGARCGGIGQHVFVAREVPRSAAAKVEPLPDIPRDRLVLYARRTLFFVGLALLFLAVFVVTMLAPKWLGGGQ